MIFDSVDSARQRWEDQVNLAFERIRSLERVCWHANCTVRVLTGVYHTTCDYCPATTASTEMPQVPVPWYFKDPEPLHLPVLQ